MSESPVSYGSDALPQTLDAFSNKDCSRLFVDECYVTPTPDEIDQLIKLAGWSQNDAAKLVGVKWDVKKGSSTIRKWKSDKSKKDNRPIPYSAWRLMLIYAGVVGATNHLNK